MKALVCVPTYNEAENIADFIGAVFAAAPSSAEMLVIDDSSPDGTAAIAEALVPSYGGRLHILRRPGKQGGASAFLHGFEWGLSRGFDAVLAMDADFSHDPAYIPELLGLASRFDAVIGSRLAKGGAIENRSPARNFISRGASLYCRALLGAPLRDWTGGYNLWSRSALEKIGIAGIVTRGYSFQIEMKYKAWKAGCTMTELPVVFPDRRRGVSKMSVSYLVKALFDVWRVRWMGVKEGTLKQLPRFAATGALGTVTNLLLFFLCADLAGLPATAVSVSCFIVAGTQNYHIHHRWSFAAQTRGTKPTVRKWALFLLSSLAGLAVNLAVMNAVLRAFAPPYKVIAQACGILAGMAINFVLTKRAVFGRKR
jgi:dolichol-phosphate mannosyltransferase